MERPRLVLFPLLVALVLAPRPRAARADEKLVLLDDVPRSLTLFEVSPDGRRLYFGSGSAYHVFDERGRLADKLGLPSGAAKELAPLPNGWFIAFNSHASGHIALFRPNGTEVRKLVTRGGNERTLRHDMTGWTSPTGGALDVGRKRIFALDTSMAQRGDPDPVWSRIAIFDFDGKYVGDINRYDGKAKGRDDAKRTWYDDIEVDPERQRVYVTARRTRELLAFAYDGKPVGKAPGRGGIAVFPDGRVAVGAAGGIRLYDAGLKAIRKLEVRDTRDLEADASGRLYASTHDPSIVFVRWSADFATRESFGPRYRRIRVDFGPRAVVAGDTLEIKAQVEGRPTPERQDAWQAMLRPTDGSDLRWRRLPAACRDGVLTASTPRELRGFHEVAVRFGDGPIALADRRRDLSVQKTFAFRPPGAERSIAVITATGRRCFRRGEPIAFHVVGRGDFPADCAVRLVLTKDGAPIASGEVRGANAALEVPAEVTRSLPPGEYELKPAVRKSRTNRTNRTDRTDPNNGSYVSYPLRLSIAQAVPDSPMQRIMYHEFDNEAVTMRQNYLADHAERMAFIRDYTQAAARLGFTRETDRLVGKLNTKTGPNAWRRDHSPVPLKHPGFAPPEYYAIPPWGANWEAELYLDQAVRWGLRYDSQLLGHCSGVRFRDAWLDELVPILQRTAQWLGRYPSFYGFNYNDEMFFGQWVTDWKQEDKDWLKTTHETKLKGRPMADVYKHALRKMYGAFNEGVRWANSKAHVTATPMWQFPAVEGSYPPVIYEDMSESYSHFLSEGYHYPWYPAHSVDFLRRPGLRLIGVFDNSYSGHGGECFLQDMMQVLGRGVQGVGVQHTRPFKDPRGASAYRIGNLLAKIYGPIFAQCQPANDAAILYSYTQDVAERRNQLGTPHFERVFALHSAALMAGIPMAITFEEDVAGGWLLQQSPIGNRKSQMPRVPLLFLVGQTKPLPPKVQQAIRLFVAAGGKLFTDAGSADYPGATKLGFKTHVLKKLFHEGYAADTTYPLFQPVLEKLAKDLHAAVAKHRRFPADTDTPWVAVNHLDGGAIRYILLSTDEGTPYPWDAGTVWALGALYRFSVLPKTATLTLPSPQGDGFVLYDLFDQCVVQPKLGGMTAQLQVDLRTFPGRLYGLAPARLGAPRIRVRPVRQRVRPRPSFLYYAVDILDDRGKRVAAKVPIRIRLFGGDVVVREIYRGTRADGVFHGAVFLPRGSLRAWTLEVTELLGGRGSVTKARGAVLAPKLLEKRSDAEVHDSRQFPGVMRQLRDRKAITLATANADILTEAQRTALGEALAKEGIQFRSSPTAPAEVTPGLWLAAGYLPRRETMGDLLWQAWHRGLFDTPLTANVPGPGRGFVAGAVAPRGRGEHCIALVGGDREGLAKAVDAFIKLVGREPQRGIYSGRTHEVAGGPAEVAPLPRLGNLVGVRLEGVQVAADGEHVLVTAKGYHRNAALVRDLGERAEVVRAARMGQAPTVGSGHVSADGARFGAAARVAAPFGQGFHLVDAATGKTQVFAGFGDIGRHQNHFAVSDDGRTVLAPGTYGVVCWRKQADGSWREAWAIDYWRQFGKLDWPVADKKERIPQFHAFIPRGATHALVLFGEFTNQGWVTPDNPCSAHLAAVRLADGKELWRFDVPIFKTLIFPTLHTSPDGSKLQLQVQKGSWNKETFRFFTVANGKALGSWDSKVAPLSVAVAGTTGNVALVFERRLLELRRPDGTLVHNQYWKSQPVSVAFAADGQSVFVADDAERLTRVHADGEPVWSVELGSVAALAAAGDRIYAARWDGRLQSYTHEGKLRWTLDCTPALLAADPMAMVAASAKYDDKGVIRATRPSTVSTDVPAGENLLRSGKATLKLGGTRSWMSDGKLQVKAEQLTNGKLDDVSTPWLHLDELFWDATAGRQVYAEITLKQPTHVKALTVHENPTFPASWPTEGLVQVWDETLKRWNTAAFGVFLRGPVSTYALDLKGATKIRYVPWSSYYRNFHTCEIQVR